MLEWQKQKKQRRIRLGEVCNSGVRNGTLPWQRSHGTVSAKRGQGRARQDSAGQGTAGQGGAGKGREGQGK